MLGVHRRLNVKDLINFNSKYVSTGQVGGYIKRLYRQEGFNHIGYYFQNNRVYLFTYSNNLEVIRYFDDRCPAMVEEDCMKVDPIAHEFRQMFSEELDPYQTYKEVIKDDEDFIKDIRNEL